MSKNPYKSQDSKAFWSRAVSENFDVLDLINSKSPLLTLNDVVTSAGSCFASNLIPYIEKAGLSYIRTEKLPDIFSTLGENLGYANFSAMYGNIYTARQLRQLYERTLGSFQPVEDRWLEEGKVVDPFRPGLKFPASSNEEFDLITKSHLTATKKAFESASVFVFTFGLTEAWIHKADGSTYPACPGTIAGKFSEDKYEFKNFSVSEVVEDFSWFVDNLLKNNPKLRFIISVSPVPLVATATKNHVLSATVLSKSILRVAAQEISNNFKNVTYFPAYEIITGPQAPNDFFEKDKRNVSKLGIEFVMNALLDASNLESSGLMKLRKLVNKSTLDKKIETLSEQISRAECDEVMLDENLQN